jgi:DNA-binding transcriptional MerR regulator
MTTTVRAPSAAAKAQGAAQVQTIGAVCRKLGAEFPDISISKIRYLEDQGLIAPRRTPGGYRLFSEDDIERLETILRLQRDEFLPLRVIRQELASNLAAGRRRRKAGELEPDEEEIDLSELCARGGITADLARDLEEYGLLSPSVSGGDRVFSESDVEITFACGRLAGSGMTARHLRTFRTTADRAAVLLEQAAVPDLRSRRPERQQEGLERLQSLGEAAQELTDLLLWKALRRIAAG